MSLSHCSQVTHICVGNLTIIDSDNGLTPSRRKAIIWTNAGILWITPVGTKFNEILMEIHTFSFKKMHLKGSSAKWRPFCLGLNVLSNTACSTAMTMISHESYHEHMKEAPYLTHPKEKVCNVYQTEPLFWTGKSLIQVFLKKKK